MVLVVVGAAAAAACRFSTSSRLLLLQQQLVGGVSCEDPHACRDLHAVRRGSEHDPRLRNLTLREFRDIVALRSLFVCLAF